MIFTTDYKLENYILNTKWEDLPQDVQNRLKGCFVDLMGALTIGSRSKQARVRSPSSAHLTSCALPVLPLQWATLPTLTTLMTATI